MTDGVRRMLRAEPLLAVFGVVAFALIAAFLWANFRFTWMVVDVVAPGADTIQVFYSANGAWNEAESLRRELAPGFNRIDFAIPGSPGAVVRLDPGTQPRRYDILRVQWVKGGVATDADLQRATADGTVAAFSAAGGKVVVSADGSDPQLLIPTPSLAWRVSLAAAPAVVLAMLLALAAWGAWRGRALVPCATAGLALAAVVFVLVCVRLGVTLPLLDDWRYVGVGGVFSFLDGNHAWLGRAGNDTYFLVGQLFDYVTLNLTRFDFTAVRAVAFTLLLVFLLLQRAVVVAAADSDVVAAAGILALLAVLGNYTYWGITAIAYHQFLPLLFGAAMLLLVLRAPAPARVADWRSAALVVLAVAAGLSYISGVFVPLALGSALLLTNAEQLHAGWRSPVIVQGVLMVVCGIALLAVQLIMVTKAQGSLLNHVHSSLAPVYPNDPRFWEFFVALFARAFGYVGASIGFDALLALVFLLPGTTLALLRIRDGFARRPAVLPQATLCAIFAAMTAALYAAAVAFGRGPYVGINASHAAALPFLKGGFHFWWLAALLPLAWLGWAALVAGRVRRDGVRTAVLAAVMAIFLLPKSLATLDVGQIFWANERAARGAYQMASDLPKARAGGKVQNTDLIGIPIDLGPSLQRYDAAHFAFFEQILADGPQAVGGDP